jgi:hypothetical protein
MVNDNLPILDCHQQFYDARRLRYGALAHHCVS